MAKRFTKLAEAIWSSKRFRALPSDKARLLLIYFLSSRHQTSVGAYEIPEGYALHDLNWDIETYREAKRVLVTAGLILFEDETDTVYVTKWFNHCPPMNKSHMTNCEKWLAALRPGDLQDRVEADYRAVIERARSTPSEKSSLPLTSVHHPFPVLAGAAKRAGR